MPRGILHIGIAVTTLEEALPLYRDALGFPVVEVEELPDRGLRVAILDAGGAEIELLESVRDDSVIARFLAGRGPGIHHLAFRVDNVAAELARLKDRGIRLVDECPRPGAQETLVAFLHPKSTGGVLLELVQSSRPMGRDPH